MSIDGQSDRADGTWKDIGVGRSIIGFVRQLNYPVRDVWAALTQVDQLIKWWGQAVLDLEVGGRFTIRWLGTDDDGASVTMDAVITEFDPESLLETEGDPHGVLRWELEPDEMRGDGTQLSFAGALELPDGRRARTLAGWHYHLDALAAHLAGEPTDLMNLPNDRWRDLNEQYERKFS